MWISEYFTTFHLSPRDCSPALPLHPPPPQCRTHCGWVSAENRAHSWFQWCWALKHTTSRGFGRAWLKDSTQSWTPQPSCTPSPTWDVPNISKTALLIVHQLNQRGHHSMVFLKVRILCRMVRPCGERSWGKRNNHWSWGKFRRTRRDAY